jgi:hypothetical protein
VNRTRDRDDHLAVGDETIALQLVGDETWISELALNVFVFLQCQYILSRTDESHDHWPLERRLAQRLDQNAIRRLVEPREVVCDLRPVGHGPIFSGGETQNRLRRRYRTQARRGPLRIRRLSGQTQDEGRKGHH